MSESEQVKARDPARVPTPDPPRRPLLPPGMNFRARLALAFVVVTLLAMSVINLRAGW